MHLTNQFDPKFQQDFSWKLTIFREFVGISNLDGQLSTENLSYKASKNGLGIWMSKIRSAKVGMGWWDACYMGIMDPNGV